MKLKIKTICVFSILVYQLVTAQVKDSTIVMEQSEYFNLILNASEQEKFLIEEFRRFLETEPNFSTTYEKFIEYLRRRRFNEIKTLKDRKNDKL